MSAAKYAAFCDAWIEQCARGSSPDGSLFIMNSVRNLQLMLDLASSTSCTGATRSLGRDLRQLHRPATSPLLAPDRLLHQARRTSSSGTAIRSSIPSDRQTKYADKRANPDGKVPGNVWTEFPRLVDNAKERMPGFPTQLPVALVERIVLAASNPGDRVLDPFNGSGTTGEAAIRHGRRYAGVELIEANAHAAKERLARVAASIERKG
jgi:adenine-specific DNA-methyltransferase